MTEEGYKIAYYVLVFLGFLITIILNPGNNHGKDKIISITMCVILSVLMGGRPLNVGTDTGMYQVIFTKLDGMRFADVMSETKFSFGPLFSLLFLICIKFANFRIALTLVCLLTNLCYFCACNLLCKTRNLSSSMCFFTLLASFTCFNQEINVIRSGLAIAIFMMFLVFLWRDNWKMMLLTGLVGVLIHYSIGIFIIVSILVKYIKKISLNAYVWIFFITIVLSYLGFSVLNLAFFTDINFDKVQAYTANVDEFDYVLGFRPAFVLFNTFFLLLFLYFRNPQSPFQEFFLKIFIVFSVVFFLWFTIPFSDRIGAYSWIIIPILGFLIASKKQLVHPTITLFMIFTGYWAICYII